MNSFSSAPFIRILPAFGAGIVCSFYHLFSCNIVFALFVAGVFGLLLFILKQRPDFKYRCLSGISLQFIYLSLGFLLTEVRDERLSEKHFSVLPTSKYFLATVDDSPKGRDGNLRTTVSLISIIQGESFISTKGKSFLYFKNDSNASNLTSGDRIIFKGPVFPISSPLNPGQYDFKYRTMVRRIYHQARLKENDWKKLPIQTDLNLKSMSVALRNKFLAVYKNAGLKGQEYAVLSALVLGYEDDIDRETMKAFSASGTLHVLSVSGMHVGIIFAAMSSILTFLGRNRLTRILRLFILLLALWFYALLTGLSPSVIRSAMMFTFILVGRSLNRSSNIYNSLALSALCIFILFDSLMLLEVGLQLSFIAVAGIAFLYPKIYQIIFIKNILLDKIWALIAVSIAAQAATFAISIYYFHQFPNYFIPANLIIIPLSTVGIFAGILLLFINPLPYLSIKAGWLTMQIIYLLNASAIFVEDLPGSVWQGISINLFCLTIIYVILFAIVYFIESKSIQYFYIFQISFIVLISSFIYKNYILSKQKNLVIFSNSASFCCQFNRGFDSVLFYHSLDSTVAFRYSNDYCISKGLSTIDRSSFNLDSVKSQLYLKNIFMFKNYILFDNYLIEDLSKSRKLNGPSTSLKSDMVFVNKYVLKSLLRDSINTNEIILNSKGVADSLEIRLIQSGINIHHLSKGARVIEL